MSRGGTEFGTSQLSPKPLDARYRAVQNDTEEPCCFCRTATLWSVQFADERLQHLEGPCCLSHQKELEAKLRDFRPRRGVSVV